MLGEIMPYVLSSMAAMPNVYVSNYSSHIPSRLPNQRQRRKLGRQSGIRKNKR